MASIVFVLSYIQLAALLFALNYFPEALPKRWEAIAVYVGLCSQLLSETACRGGTSISVEVVDRAGDEQVRKKTRQNFSGSSKECKQVANIINDVKYADVCSSTEFFYKPLLSNPDITSPLKPIILVPPVLQCCELRLAIRNRPSFPLVFTKAGTYIAASYHGQCQKCGTSYYPSFYGNGEEQILYNFEQLKSLQISAQTAFAIDYLDNVTNQLSICSSTFESIAELYTISNMDMDNDRLSNLVDFGRVSSSTDIPWKLNPQRLEEAWFIHRIGLFYRGVLNVNMHTELHNCRRKVEKLCKEVYDIIVKESPKWIKHACFVPGCSERFAMLDGNEKLTRTMCSAPKCKVKIPKTGISVMSVCPNTPQLGGNRHKALKYCNVHQHIDDSSSDSSSTSSILDLESDPDNLKLSHLDAKEVTNDENLESQDLGNGCRKKTNIHHYLDRTAGIAAIVRPCGIIVNVTEMYTCESMTQMYLFLLGTFGSGKDIQHLKWLGYDRACGFEPFLQNLSKKGIYLAKYLLKNTKFLVDRFHIKGHTEICCLPPDQNPECKYHPDLPVFSEISKANTECAEQAFRWLNKLKFSLRQMGRYKFNFFLYEMVNIHKNCI